MNKFRKLVLLAVGMFLFNSLSFAETIYLKTGKKIRAQILERSDKQIKVDISAVLNVNEIIPRLVPVYDKYFSEDELKELIAFYKGATGRKLIKVMPLIMEDSMKATEAYFQEKMPASNHDGTGPAPENQKK